METQHKFIGASILMVVGLLPIVLCMLLYGSVIVFGGGLSDAFLVIGIGGLAYGSALVVSGVGLLWSKRIVHKSHATAPTLVRVLGKVVAVVLVAPWLMLVANIVIGSVIQLIR